MQNGLMCQQGCRKWQPPSMCMRLGRLFIHLWEQPDEGRIVPSVPQLPHPPASSIMGNTSTVCCHGATRVPLLSCWGHLSCLQVLCESVDVTWLWWSVRAVSGVSLEWRMGRACAHCSLLPGQVLACLAWPLLPGTPQHAECPTASLGGTSCCHFGSAVALCQPAVASGRISPFGGVK